MLLGFLMFNVFDPHVARLSGKDGQRGPQYFPDQVEGLPHALLGPEDIAPWPWQQIDTPAQRKKIAGYYNCVHRLDAAIGRLLKELEASGQASNTLIILLGDHGPPFARGKTSCYEAGLRVPFLVRWPGISQPHISERLVSSVDIYPTILDAVGADVPEGIHGRSLRSILAPAEDSRVIAWRQTLAAEFHFHGASPFFPRRAIRDGRYKLIHNLRAGELRALYSIDGDDAYHFAQQLPAQALPRLAMERLAEPPEWELYDLQEDPIEFQNRADDPALAAVRASLEAALTQWQDETHDPFREPAFRDSIERQYQPK